MNFYPANIEDELELRPPLPLEHGPDVPIQYKYVLHNHLCRMYLACDSLELGTEGRYASLVLFHRYACHYFHNHNDFDVNVNVNVNVKELHKQLGKVASACLFLGSKTTEQARRLRDIINVSYKLDFMCERQNMNVNHSNDELSNIDIYEATYPPDLDDMYWDMKETLIVVEQSVLRLLHFDFIVSSPHKVLWLIVKTMNDDGYSEKERCDTNTPTFMMNMNPFKKQNLYQRECIMKQAWSILNNTLFHTDALRFDVIVLASAALYISIKQITQEIFEKVKIDQKSNNYQQMEEEKVENNQNWWKLFGVSDTLFFKAVTCIENQL